jgi:general secretion pathway protein B
MSYILDALRRADSERERGLVPGIHAQPVPVVSPEDVSRGRPKPWVWVVVGVTLGLLMPLAWLLFGRDAPTQTGDAVAALAPPPPIPAPPERSAPEPAGTLPAAPPAFSVPDRPIERRPTSTEVQPVARKPAAPAASAAPAVEERVYARNELPDEIRRQLPALTIGGSIYSSNPANRFLVINGLVVYEKGELGPEHVLELIKPKAAVLRFKGYRYEINY